MAAYTEHYHLHQWEPEDNFLRTDFNEDFRVLDKALALKPEILSGSYTGDDARSRDISLGVSPRAVFVVRQDGAMQSDMYTYGGLALQGAPVTMRDGNLVEITSSGIRVARGDLIEGRFYADANRSGMSPGSGRTPPAPPAPGRGARRGREHRGSSYFLPWIGPLSVW